MYDTETGFICVSYKPLNAGNNQLTIVWAFSYTETCSFRGFQTRTYERFRGSSDAYATVSLLTRLFPCCKSRLNISSRSCHWSPWAAHILIQTRMHANSDTETVTRNDRSKLKGQYTDVKSGCGPSVGPSLKPQSQLKQLWPNTVSVDFIVHIEIFC